jgi:lauroyl/myristoyl acyltransferase
VRKANDSTVVTVYPPITLERTGDRARDTLVGTQQIARVVEDMIRRTPEQWVVLQKVWPDPNPQPTAPAPAVPDAPAAVAPDPDPQLTRT